MTLSNTPEQNNISAENLINNPSTLPDFYDRLMNSEDSKFQEILNKLSIKSLKILLSYNETDNLFKKPLEKKDESEKIKEIKKQIENKIGKLKDGNKEFAQAYSNNPSNNIASMSHEEFHFKKTELYDPISKESGKILQAMLNTKLPIIEKSGVEVADVSDAFKKYETNGYYEGPGGDVIDHIGPDGVYHPPKENNSSFQRKKPENESPFNKGNNINGKQYPDEFSV